MKVGADYWAEAMGQVANTIVGLMQQKQQMAEKEKETAYTRGKDLMSLLMEEGKTLGVTPKLQKDIDGLKQQLFQGQMPNAPGQPAPSVGQPTQPKPAPQAPAAAGTLGTPTLSASPPNLLMDMLKGSLQPSTDLSLPSAPTPEDKVLGPAKSFADIAKEVAAEQGIEIDEKGKPLNLVGGEPYKEYYKAVYERNKEARAAREKNILELQKENAAYERQQRGIEERLTKDEEKRARDLTKLDNPNVSEYEKAAIKAKYQITEKDAYKPGHIQAFGNAYKEYVGEGKWKNRPDLGKPSDAHPPKEKDKDEPNLAQSVFVDQATGKPLVFDKKAGRYRVADVEGTGAAPRPTAQTPEAAAKTQLVEQGLSYLPRIRSGLFDKNGKVDRVTVVNIAARTPGTKGRELSTLILDAVEAKLRAESGAAVPDSEVTRIAKRFIPQIPDKDSTIKIKIDNLETFLKGTLDKINRGRLPAGKGQAPVPVTTTPKKIGRFTVEVE